MLFQIVFCIIAFVCSYFDLRYWRIPDLITLPTTAFFIVIDFAYKSLDSQRFLAAASVALILLVSGRLTSSGIGLGDVKLGFLLGYAFGFIDSWFILIIATLTGIIVLLIRKNSNEKRIPFAPFIATGAFCLVLYKITPLLTQGILY